MNNLETKENFYDSISSFYDDMINFEKALEIRKSAFKKLIPEGSNFAADLGCGSGLDSIALSLNGLNVSAFDLSPEMIKHAKMNAKKFNVEIDFNNSSTAQIPNSFNNKYSFVVSMGNTFANFNYAAFQQTIKVISSLLIENGQAVIQILNYHQILQVKERIINITESSEKYFVRFYDFVNEEIWFNILSFSKSKTNERKLVTTPIYPYYKKDFSDELLKNNFRNIQFFSSLNKEPFDETTSKDLLIIAQK